MSKIVVQKKRGRVVIVNRLTHPEMENVRICNAIASGALPSFVPVTVKKKRKETRVECVVQGLMTLEQYFTGMVSKDIFLDLVQKIVTIVKDCEKNSIDSRNIDLKKDRVFINPISKEVKCVYWPIVNNANAVLPDVFFKQLPMNVGFNPHEDNSYLKLYIDFFDRTKYDPFSINSFERFILKLKGQRVVTHSDGPSEGLGGRSGKVPPIFGRQGDQGPQGGIGNIEYDPFAGRDPRPAVDKVDSVPGQSGFVFCTNCGVKNNAGAKFCRACGCGLNTNAAQANDVPVAKPVERVEGTRGLEDPPTTLLGSDEPEELLVPRLLRRKSGQKYNVKESLFCIGTDPATCDLVIDDNTYISRNHADIVTRDERFFVYDRKSTNKTYVDGKVVERETEVEIFNGTVLKLANEEFVFSLEKAGE